MDELEGGQAEAFGLEAADDLANQAALDAVRLCGATCKERGFGSMGVRKRKDGFERGEGGKSGPIAAMRVHRDPARVP